MGDFRTPQIVLFTRDIDRAVAFYRDIGFNEVFRTPPAGTPIHVDLDLDGYRLGLATEASTRDDHGLSPVGPPPSFGPDGLRVVDFDLMGALPSVLGWG